MLAFIIAKRGKVLLNFSYKLFIFFFIFSILFSNTIFFLSILLTFLFLHFLFIYFFHIFTSLHGFLYYYFIFVFDIQKFKFPQIVGMKFCYNQRQRKLLAVKFHMFSEFKIHWKNSWNLTASNLRWRWPYFILILLFFKKSTLYTFSRVKDCMLCAVSVRYINLLC